MRKSLAAAGSLLVALAGCGPSGSGPGSPGPEAPPPPASPCEEAPPVPERGWYPLQPGRPHGLTKVVAHPRDAQLLFAVGLDRGLWRSDDGGQRFCPASTPARVTDVYPAAADAGVVYARAGDPDVLLRSADGGRSWVAKTWPDRGSRLIVDPASADVLYLELAGASTTPLVRSLDGGATWNTMGPPLPEPSYIWRLVVDPGNPDLFYGAGPCGQSVCLWRRSEAAGSYQLMRREARPPGVPALDLVVDRASRLFRTSEPGPPRLDRKRRLERSLDGGATFTMLPALPDGMDVLGVVADEAAPGNLYALAVGDTPSAASVLESADGGDSWMTVARGPLAAGPDALYPQLSLTVSSAPRRTFLVAGGAAVFRFEGGAAPVPILTDPGAAGSLEAAPSAPQILYAIDRARLYRSADGGASWELRPTPDFQPLSFAVDPTEADRLWGVFARSYGNVRRGLFRSDDGGRTWQAVGGLPAPPSPGTLVVPRLAPGTIYLTSASGVLVSSDRGSTWRLAPVPDGVESLAVPASDPRIGYVSDPENGKVYATRDGFATLAPTTPLPTEDEDTGLLVDPHNPQVLLALQENLAYRTTDGGQTWAPASGFPTPTGRPAGLIFHPYVAGVLFSTAQNGFQISDDGGATWRPANLGLPPGTVPHILAFDPRSPTTLLTPLATAGIWKTTTAGQ
jgi:photosystem II stability/assembly factor-like uncharacterized protein